MSYRLRAAFTPLLLLAVALAWMAVVYWTIEPTQGPAAGPRAFPLFFGAALAVLSLMLLFEAVCWPEAPEIGPDERSGSREGFSVVATIAAITVYGALLEPIGFIPATVVMVAALMVFVLRIRAPVQVAALSIGLSLGCYLVFNKLLGTYLPPGTLISIYL